jgi:protoheme IX farnesyltransferase
MRASALPAALALPAAERHRAADWRDYLALLKPRVIALVAFTGACGLLAAPTGLHPVLALTAILMIAAGAGAAGALNQAFEADIDALMQRTRGRPLPMGRIAPGDALAFAGVLALLAVGVLGLATNWLAAALLAAAILFYAGIYTLWLKRRTAQNIVIGGAAGAFPPVIGWAAATGEVAALPLILFAIICLWTPPHFWALALYCRGDYARAGIPMLPVTHGEAATRRQILRYSLALVAAGLAPLPLGLAGWLYGLVAGGLGAWFLLAALAVARSRELDPARMLAERRLFRVSLAYLALIFTAIAADRMLLA